MTVQCVTCASFTLQNADGRSGTELAKQGFGTCKHKPGPGRYESARFERHCHMFVKADKATSIKRVDWLAARQRERENIIRAAQGKEPI